MDEVRRFMRYVLPGMVFVTEVIAFFVFSHGKRAIVWIQSFASGETLGTGVAILFGSGAIGFILANIYHTLHWSFDRIAIDHRSLFDSGPHQFRAVDAGGTPLISLSKRDAWTIVTHYCQVNSAMPGGEDIKGMREITDRLVDITHSIGATLIGTVLALFAWVLGRLLVLDEPLSSFWAGSLIPITALWIALLVVFGVGYWRTAKALERIANSHILVRLSKLGSPGGPTDIVYKR